MFTINTKQAVEEILTCCGAGLTPYLTSSPGMGKSSLVHQIANDHDLKVIDVRLSQCTPEDLQGFPMRQGDKATFTPFDIFPVEGDPLPRDEDGNEMSGWMLFLDELSSATKPVQAAAYKLILDRQVGSYKLHKNVAIVAAGNKATDKAVVNQMSTALQSRLINYELEVDPKAWTEWALQSGVDHRVTGFISFKPSMLMDFRADHTDKTFACPRTWEFLSRLVKGRDIEQHHGARIAGTIGEGAAVEFMTFAQEYGKLPSFNAILADPKGTPIPREASTKYATMSMLMENFEPGNLDEVLDYVERFDTEIQVIFCRGAVVRKPEIRTNHQKFQDYLMKMLRYLN